MNAALAAQSQSVADENDVTGSSVDIDLVVIVDRVAEGSVETIRVLKRC